MNRLLERKNRTNATREVTMKNCIAVLVTTLVCATPSFAGVLDVRIWETPFTGGPGGGRYTISVGEDTQVWAFGVTTTLDAGSVFVERSRWTGDLVTSSLWNDGYEFTQYDPFFDPILSASTGEDGFGTFIEVFGAGSVAALFWADDYLADYIGPFATSSQFGWEYGPPTSTAFALVAEGGGSVLLVCDVVGSDENTSSQCTPFETPPSGNAPTPTTIALFGLGLASLGWSRRTKA
ncbi:MAG: PEP-CTERM sorting domain-containing protein [Gammaproteobacteria bacterium]